MLDGNLTNKEKYQESEMRARAAQLVQLITRYWTRRVLDNKVMDVLQAKLVYEVLVFLSRKQLCEAVGRHISSRLPFNSDSSSFHLLAEPHLMDINVTKLGLDSISVALSEAYSLRIVTPESLLGMKHKADVAAESILVL